MTTEPDLSPSPWQDGVPYVLWRAQQAVHGRAQEALDGLGVTVTQLGLAVHLDELGLMSASDLSRRFHITPQSVTTALNRLEQLGWVRRRPHPVHKRVIWYELSETGLAGVADGRTRMAAVGAAIGEILGKSAEAALVGELRRIVTALDGEDPPAEPMWPVPGMTGPGPRGTG